VLRLLQDEIFTMSVYRPCVETKMFLSRLEPRIRTFRRGHCWPIRGIDEVVRMNGMSAPLEPLVPSQALVRDISGLGFSVVVKYCFINSTVLFWTQ
jgi:hypothetical protein